MTESDEKPGNVDKKGSKPIRISEDKERRKIMRRKWLMKKESWRIMKCH